MNLTREQRIVYRNYEILGNCECGEDSKKAIFYYKKANRIKPTSRLYNLIGEEYVRLKKYKNAVCNFIRAIEVNPNNEYPYINIDDLIDKFLYIQCDDVKITDLYEKLIKEDPNNVLPYKYILKIRIEESKIIKYCKKVIKLDPKYSDAYRILGYTYEEQKDWSKSITIYKKYLGLNPSGSDVYYRIASSYLNKGLINKAIKYYIQYYKESKDSNICFTIGNLLWKSGKKSEAIKYYTQVSEISIVSTINIKKEINNKKICYITEYEFSNFYKCLGLIEFLSKATQDFVSLLSQNPKSPLTQEIINKYSLTEMEQNNYRLFNHENMFVTTFQTICY